jgi:aldose sugar dehydrogenase
MKLICALLCLLPSTAVMAQTVYQSEKHDFTVEVLSDELRFPWGLAFLPNGDFLVTERPGGLKRVTADGELHAIGGIPEVAATGQGGMLDVALDPDFAENNHVFLCFSAGDFSGLSTELARATLNGDRLDDVRVLFVAEPKVFGGRHFGCRIDFDNDGYLYLAVGERGDPPNSQNLNTHHGGVMRLNRDGTVPSDNPFVGSDNVREEIYTYGNRNPQGMTRHPQTGVMWELEHGPQGGDEVNILLPGANYGWPVVSYGGQYGTGRQIGEGTQKEGIEDPVYYWDPSIAPSGMTFYQGDVFPDWNGNLFIGALKFRLLSRLVMDGDRVVSEERLLEGELGRIRDVRTGPDGFLYLLTDADPGMLARLKPAD